MKIKNIVIDNFRSFSHFNIRNLGRINLLVGTNNSGKTSVLEALYILFANSEVSVIWSILARRGEDLWIEREAAIGTSYRQVDIRRLFRGHEIEVGSSFALRAETDLHGPISMHAEVTEPRPAQPGLFENEGPPPDSAEDFLPPLGLNLGWLPGRGYALPINRRGGVTLDSIRRSGRGPISDGFNVRLVSATSLSADLVTTLFEDIVLTPAEELVTEAMRIIEPDLERLASSGGDRLRTSSRYPTRGGILVKLKGIKDRVPIGSLGDGIWRMLGLALSVVQAAGGLLLVDEIDTGLHHTVMKDLWRFLRKCAVDLDVQIVATTHSRDCFQALAAICRDSVSEGSEVTIHRIERGEQETIAYTEQEIVAAADYDMEVR